MRPAVDLGRTFMSAFPVHDVQKSSQAGLVGPCTLRSTATVTTCGQLAAPQTGCCPGEAQRFALADVIEDDIGAGLFLSVQRTLRPRCSDVLLGLLAGSAIVMVRSSVHQLCMQLYYYHVISLALLFSWARSLRCLRACRGPDSPRNGKSAKMPARKALLTFLRLCGLGHEFQVSSGVPFR